MSSITFQEYSDKSFLIKGDDTIKFKDTLKEFGGKWNTSLGGWIFSNTHKAKIQKFLEVIKMHTPLSSTTPVTTKPLAKSSGNGELLVKDYTEKCFVLYGDTQQHKDKIKELGGKWNANLKDGLKGWIFPMTKKKVVEDFIKNRDGGCADDEEVYYEAVEEEQVKPMPRLLRK